MGLAAAITTVVAAGGGGFGRGFSPASYGICGSREIPSLNRPLKCSNRIGKLRRRERPPYLRVKCFVNGKEDRKTIGDVSREDSSENGAHEGKRNAVILAEEEGTSDEKWQPPWMNIPQRYKLIGATSLAFVICNMDKVNLSVAIIPMSHEFGWNSSTAGLVQSSFFWGYALSQLPGGWLAKIYGGRKVLEIGVLGWSLATMLVPLVAGFMPGLLLSRVLVGIGEGISPSSATDIIARASRVHLEKILKN